MPIILNVTPEKLKASAAQLQSQASAMKSLTTSMTTLVSGISGRVWSGEAASAYKTKFQGLNEEILALNKLCQDHAVNLQEIASNYEQAEVSGQSAASGLSSGV